MFAEKKYNLTIETEKSNGITDSTHKYLKKAQKCFGEK
jgi:hypothetical protein